MLTYCHKKGLVTLDILKNKTWIMFKRKEKILENEKNVGERKKQLWNLT